MQVKKSVKIVISFCLLSFAMVFLYSTTHPQGGKEIAFTGDFKPYFTNDRIVIKLYSEVGKSNLIALKASNIKHWNKIV